MESADRDGRDHADEGVLIARACTGDAAALEALLSASEPTLRAVLASAIPDRWRASLSADDVLQQTFTDAFLDVATFEPAGHGSFERWLVALARNNARDAVRALETQRRGGHLRRVDSQSNDELSADLFERLTSSRATPSRSLARREAAEIVRAAIARLPEPWRQVVEAHDLRGESMDEIARALGRSEGAAWLLRHRALAQLARLLGDADRFPSSRA